MEEDSPMLYYITHLESAKASSDNTSSQGAQDLNDLLGLPKGAIFEEGQQRNLRQLHQDSYYTINDGS